MEPIEALKLGEEAAIAWLVETFSKRLLKAATLMLGDEHLAEDAVQDCFMDAISHISSFRGQSSVYTWLYTILLRRCNRERKRGLRQIQILKEVEPSFAIPPISVDNTLREAIKSLKYRYREVIVLFYYEEFSIKDISLLLGEPEGTIKNKLHRARQKLKNLLEREEDLCI